MSINQLKHKIMKADIKFPLLILTISVISCSSPRIYTTGSYATIKSYTDKPLYKGEKESATYVSGDIAIGSHEQREDAEDHFKDNKTLFSAKIHRSTSRSFFNYYYGAGFAMGSYKFKRGYSNLVKDGEKSAFYNFNLKTGININYNRPKMEWRFIGIEFTYLNEFGPYQDKLKYLIESNDNGLEIINEKSLFTYNLYSEYVFKSTKNEDGFLIGFYVGDLLNYDKEEYGYSASYHGLLFAIILKDLTISLNFEAGNGNIKSTKFGLSYKL